MTLPPMSCTIDGRSEDTQMHWVVHGEPTIPLDSGDIPPEDFELFNSAESVQPVANHPLPGLNAPNDS